jgi:hypothetical protein
VGTAKSGLLPVSAGLAEGSDGSRKAPGLKNERIRLWPNRSIDRCDPGTNDRPQELVIEGLPVLYSDHVAQHGVSTALT